MSNIIDEADLRLLFALDQNSRASFATLARSLRMAPETVRYRVSNLVERGVVKKFFTIVDAGRLGLAIHKLYLKLQYLTDRQLSQIIRLLSEMPEVLWVFELEGSFDLAFAVRTRNLYELDIIVNTVLRRFGPSIIRRSLAVNVLSEYFPRTHLVDRVRSIVPTSTYSLSGKVEELDSIDSVILEMLSRDSRVSASMIAETIATNKKIIHPIGREAVLQRIKRLEKRKIISGYTIIPKHETLGLSHCRICISVNQLRPNVVERVIKHIKQDPHVWYVIKVFGEWDYEIGFEVPDNRVYQRVLNRASSLAPGVIRDWTVLHITETHKYEVISLARAFN